MYIPAHINAREITSPFHRRCAERKQPSASLEGYHNMLWGCIPESRPNLSDKLPVVSNAVTVTNKHPTAILPSTGFPPDWSNGDNRPARLALTKDKCGDKLDQA
jgi:hypothetical protein